MVGVRTKRLFLIFFYFFSLKYYAPKKIRGPPLRPKMPLWTHTKKESSSLGTVMTGRCWNMTFCDSENLRKLPMSVKFDRVFNTRDRIYRSFCIRRLTKRKGAPATVQRHASWSPPPPPVPACRCSHRFLGMPKQVEHVAGLKLQCLWDYTSIRNSFKMVNVCRNESSL